MKKIICSCIAALSAPLCVASGTEGDSCAITKTTVDKWTKILERLPKISGYLQTGWNYNTLGEGTSTFQIKRLRLLMDGTVTDKASFRLQVEAFSGTPGHHNGQKSFQVMDAYATYRFNPHFQVRAGQFNSPLCYENYNLSPATMETVDFSSLCSRILFRNAIGYDYSDFGRDLGIMLFGDVLPAESGFNRLSYNLSLTNGHLPSIDDNNKSKEVQAVIFYRPVKKLDIKAGYNYGEYNGIRNLDGRRYQPMHRMVGGIWYNDPEGLDLRAEYGYATAKDGQTHIVKENLFYVLAAYHFGPLLPVLRYDMSRDGVRPDAIAGNYDKFLAGASYTFCKNIKLQANYTLTRYTDSSTAGNDGHRTSSLIQLMGLFSF